MDPQLQWVFQAQAWQSRGVAVMWGSARQFDLDQLAKIHAMVLESAVR